MFRKIQVRFEKHKQFYKRLISYALVMFLAVMVNMIGYGVTLRVLENEVEKNNVSVVKNIRLSCDGFYSELMSAAYSLLRSSSVQHAAQETLSDYERIKYTRDVQLDMAGVMSSGVEDCAVLVRNNDMCIQNSFGIFDFDMAYKYYYSNYYKSKEEWLSSIFSVSGAKFMPFFTNGTDQSLEISFDDESEQYTPARHVKLDGTQMFLIYRIPNINQQIVVLLKLDSQYMSEHLTTDRSETEQTFVIDENGDVIFGSENCMKIENLEGIGNEIRSFDSSKYMVTVADSENTPFRYVHMVDSELYLRQVKRVRNAFALGYLLCVLLAGGLSWWFALIGEKRKRRIEAELAEQRRYLKPNVLRQALFGEFGSLSDVPEGYKDILSGNSYIVLLFDVLPLFEDEEDEEGVDIEIFSQYLSARISDISAGYSVEFCTIDDMCAGILRQDSDADPEGISSELDRICVSLGAELNVDVCCAVSAVVDKISDLPKAYEQVCEVISFRFLGDSKNVFVYDDVLQAAPRYSFTFDSGKRMIDMFVLGDYQGVEKMINEKLAFSNTKQHVSLGTLRMITVDTILILLEAAERIDADEEMDTRQLYMLLTQLNTLGQLNEVRKSILQYAEEMCDMVRKGTPKKLGDKYRHIEEYIRENYTDNDLNVNKLADVFKINRSWLSKNFHDEVGVSISEYIIRCRLNKAKVLLKTDMTVAQIAQATGFSDTGQYCRAFKKYEGITSMQYRQLLGNKRQGEKE